MQGLYAHTDWLTWTWMQPTGCLPPSTIQRGFLPPVCRDQFPLTNFTGFPIWNGRSQQWDLPHQPQSCSGNATLKRKFQVPCIIKIYFNKLHSSWQPACWSQRAENQHKMPQTEMHDIQTCSATTFSTSTGRTLGWPYQHIPLPSILHWCGIN